MVQDTVARARRSNQTQQFQISDLEFEISDFEFEM
jgi:hypothetical protein